MGSQKIAPDYEHILQHYGKVSHVCVHVVAEPGLKHCGPGREAGNQTMAGIFMGSSLANKIKD